MVRLLDELVWHSADELPTEEKEYLCVKYSQFTGDPLFSTLPYCPDGGWNWFSPETKMYECRVDYWAELPYEMFTYLKKAGEAE